jgi:hypothetical protein
VVAYQGEVRVDGESYTGTGYFKFAIVGEPVCSTYWSNDGSSAYCLEPLAAVPSEVSEGLFSVLLGDTDLDGMTEALTADAFSEPDRSRRVWFSASGGGGTYDVLTPDTRIASVPYALRSQVAVDADTVDGLHADELGSDYENVVIVAKSGGDFDSVQAAIDSIGDAGEDNAYLVWVAPGVYVEQVTMKPFVHLQGSGQQATVITSTASGGGFPPSEVTLVLASDTNLRDLTVGNSGGGASNGAVRTGPGMARTLVSGVIARAEGSGSNNYAIMVAGTGASVALQQVTALADNASILNCALSLSPSTSATLLGGSFIARGGTQTQGIRVTSGATLEGEGVTALGESASNWSYGLYSVGVTALHGGSFTARGGTNSRGIYQGTSGASLTLEQVTVLGENASNLNIGLHNDDGAAATLRGGSFSGRGGMDARGINNTSSGTMLEADDVAVVAENGSTLSHGLFNADGAEANLRGGSWTGRGGTYARGIFNFDNGPTLEAHGVSALAEDGSTDNYGLINRNGATAKLRGGSFTGRGGPTAGGIYIDGDGAVLEADSVMALGENGSSTNIGLQNENAGSATLRGGSQTGRGGSHADGIRNSSALTAEGVIATGENAMDENFGLYNVSGAMTRLRISSVTGRGGSTARGIQNWSAPTSDSATLDAEGIHARAEGASASNWGVFNYTASFTATQSVLAGDDYSVYVTTGSATVSNSRLVGGGAEGAVTCVLVTRDGVISTDGSTCP